MVESRARLSESAQATIRDTVQEVFGPRARVLLFGSRTDPEARGGDIDLLVQCPEPLPDARQRELTLVARLQTRLGDQRIDVIVEDADSEPQAIHREAHRTGIVL